jgi:hypothetical protein
MREGLRFLAIYFVIGLLIILPLQFLWGQMLGMYP